MTGLGHLRRMLRVCSAILLLERRLKKNRGEPLDGMMWWVRVGGGSKRKRGRRMEVAAVCVEERGRRLGTRINAIVYDRARQNGRDRDLVTWRLETDNTVA